MTAYFVMGIVTVAWAVLLTGLGLTRKDFPPSGRGLRAIIGITVLLVAGTLAALIATTHKEHPREEAEKQATEAQKQQAEAPPAKKQSAGGAGGKLSVVENEFNIDLSAGDTLDPGKYTFEVDNSGRVDHDLAIQGGGSDRKTPLIKPGGHASLTVDLAAGKYKLYCTVPGHEQSGMKVDLTVQ